MDPSSRASSSRWRSPSSARPCSASTCSCRAESRSRSALVPAALCLRLERPLGPACLFLGQASSPFELGRPLLKVLGPPPFRGERLLERLDVVGDRVLGRHAGLTLLGQALVELLARACDL